MIFKREDKEFEIIRREIAELRLELNGWEKKPNSPHKNVKMKEIKTLIDEKEVKMKELLAKIRLRSKFR